MTRKLKTLSTDRRASIVRKLLSFEFDKETQDWRDEELRVANKVYDLFVPSTFRKLAEQAPAKWFKKFNVYVKLDGQNITTRFQLDKPASHDMDHAVYPLFTDEQSPLSAEVFTLVANLAAWKKDLASRRSDREKVLEATIKGYSTTKLLLNDMPGLVDLMGEDFFYTEKKIQLPATTIVTEINDRLSAMKAA